MNQERDCSRRTFLKGSLLVVGSTLSSCVFPDSKETPQILTSLPTPEKKPVPTPEVPAPSLQLLLEKDLQLKSLVEQASKEEILQLENPLTKHILRFPWEGGEAYLATLGALTQEGESKTTVIFLSADCLYEVFKKENLLGDSIFPGVWQPEKRVDEITAKVLMPAGVGIPLPILNLQTLTYRNLTQACQEETALERLRELVGRINWQEIPEETGKFISWFTREFIEGLKKGWQK